jgi:intein/homing endonuclease
VLYYNCSKREGTAGARGTVKGIRKKFEKISKNPLTNRPRYATIGTYQGGKDVRQGEVKETKKKFQKPLDKTLNPWYNKDTKES